MTKVAKPEAGVMAEAATGADSMGHLGAIMDKVGVMGANLGVGITEVHRGEGDMARMGAITGRLGAMGANQAGKIMGRLGDMGLAEGMREAMGQAGATGANQGGAIMDQGVGEAMARQEVATTVALVEVCLVEPYLNFVLKN